MCTFLSTLPKRSKTAGTNKKRNLVLSIRPCKDENGEKAWYRFRLLNFASPTGERDYPFIQRYVHQMWHVSEKGYPEIESEVVCPVTKWMDWHESDRYNTCPICRYANQQWKALSESNFKDQDARKKNRDFGRKFQAIIPVYVKSDPNYEGNNGKLKVIIFNDKKFYDEFVKKIEKQLLKCNCFNGTEAADICIHMSEIPEVVNEGQPNEYTWKKRVIDQIAFSKPYTIPAITKQLVDDFPFDETYYVGSTKDEIDAFYKRYIKVSNDDIVEDESNTVNIYDAPKTEVVKPTHNVVPTKLENDDIPDTSDDITDDDMNDITADADVLSSDKAESENKDDDDMESLMKELDLDLE